MSCFEYPPHAWETIDIEACGWKSDDEEPMGSKEKWWVRDDSGHLWLLKLVSDKGGARRAEDWVECVVHALSGLIGVPTACVNPALSHDHRAVLSKSVLSNEERLEHGNELLSRHDPDYQRDTTRENAGYTVEAVYKALQGAASPNGATDEFGAFFTWAGYLLMDAWVAGQDRHHENWAVITGSNYRRLAPSFDHGNALGYQVPEQQLGSIDVLEWVARGRSPHFSGRPRLVTLAQQALQMAGSQASDYWLGRLSSVHFDDVDAILGGVPETILSVARRKFVRSILQENQRRISDACSA